MVKECDIQYVINMKRWWDDGIITYEDARGVVEKVIISYGSFPLEELEYLDKVVE